MLYVLLGNTCSGKTTLQKELVRLTGIKPLVTYTNRPMRDNEVEGKDYFFISTKEIESPVYVNKRYFYTIHDVKPYIYGIHYDDLKDEEDKIAILDPSGVYNLRNLIGEENLKTLYLDIPEKIIKERAKLRGDEEAEIERRLEDDRPGFESIKEDCDVILTPLSGDITGTAYKFIKGGENNEL